MCVGTIWRGIVSPQLSAPRLSTVSSLPPRCALIHRTHAATRAIPRPRCRRRPRPDRGPCPRSTRAPTAARPARPHVADRCARRGVRAGECPVPSAAAARAYLGLPGDPKCSRSLLTNGKSVQSSIPKVKETAHTLLQYDVLATRPRPSIRALALALPLLLPPLRAARGAPLALRVLVRLRPLALLLRADRLAQRRDSLAQRLVPAPDVRAPLLLALDVIRAFLRGGQQRALAVVRGPTAAFVLFRVLFPARVLGLLAA